MPDELMTCTQCDAVWWSDEVPSCLCPIWACTLCKTETIFSPHQLVEHFENVHPTLAAIARQDERPGDDAWLN